MKAKWIKIAMPLVLGANLLLGVASCEAELEEGCLDGVCDPSAQGTNPPPTDSCPEDTGDFPCDVFLVLVDNCQTCHSDPPSGPPFSLVRWEDTQAEYGPVLIWQKMEEAVNHEPTAVPMPFMQVEKIEAGDLETLNDWFAECEAGACPQAE